MCRLYGFRANELTKVDCSLVRSQNELLVQSRSDGIGRSPVDGWGIACYGDLSQSVQPYPELVRHATAAFSSDHFSHQAESTFTEAVVAHVRLATVGFAGPTNSHPFTHENWTFANNGTVTGFDDLQEEMARESGVLQNFRLGSTDSEQLFLWLLNRMQIDGVSLAKPVVEQVERSLTNSIGELESRCKQVADEPARMTFVLTNGPLMFGCRWKSPLFQLVRNGVRDCEICGVPHIRHDDLVDYRAVLFASEPITDENWIEVPDCSLCTVDADVATNRCDLKAPAAGLNPDHQLT